SDPRSASFVPDADPNDEGAAFVALACDEEWVARRRDDLEEREVVMLARLVDRDAHLIAAIRQDALHLDAQTPTVRQLELLMFLGRELQFRARQDLHRAKGVE